jgi:hypothetical protein
MNQNIIRAVLNCGIVPFLTFLQTKKFREKEVVDPPREEKDEKIKSFSNLPESKMAWPRDLVNKQVLEQILVFSIFIWICYCFLIRIVEPAQYNTFNVFSMGLAFTFRAASYLPLCSWLPSDEACSHTKVKLVLAELGVLLLNVWSGFSNI